MSAKITASRRRAFLSALEASGNVTLSAERAKVSRSWVQLHRSGDAEFDSACRAAIAAARERLAIAPAQDPLSPTLCPQGRGSRRPPAGWRFAAGEELVVSGTNGVRTQIRRAKLKQWTPRVEERFLSALAASCNVRRALAAVGMSKGSAYAHRQRFPAFAKAWAEAIAIGTARLDCVLIQNFDFAFDPECPPPELDLGKITVTDVIRTLGMYAKRGR